MINPVASTNVAIKGALMTAGSMLSLRAPKGSRLPTLVAHTMMAGNANPTIAEICQLDPQAIALA